VYVAQAQRHLQAGWEYTNALPRSAVRVRLACAWPLWLGFRTLELLRSANVLDPRERTKVSRKELKKMVLRSVISYPFPGAWRRLMPAVKC
jgi:farnesyl-diphosphate farnesyltransferase